MYLVVLTRNFVKKGYSKVDPVVKTVVNMN